MKGRIIYRGDPKPHSCRTPIFNWIYGLRRGAIWECNCGQLWKLIQDPYDFGTIWTPTEIKNRLTED